MKKIIFACILLSLTALNVKADELTANQVQTLDTNRVVVTVQKQPTDEKSQQKQAVKNNWFCVVVQVNGKVPFEPNKGNN